MAMMEILERLEKRAKRARHIEFHSPAAFIRLEPEDFLSVVEDEMLPVFLIKDEHGSRFVAFHRHGFVIVTRIDKRDLEREREHRR